MGKDAAQVVIHAIIIAIIILIISRFLLFPEVCRVFPLQLPGRDFDFCLFFR
jgi:hypothetical protein